ncbi:hypothetical protein PanWU01x14_168470 [Parasponia andersonii]|uniref:Uncharacterized protein n=1 Tax=Parasponia andersonii TaxID=3476 RepID=A0A2P5CB32_PARAD|nr:hypothetical protein PanWU01x14_168470 [Parasponia andersonii]
MEIIKRGYEDRRTNEATTHNPESEPKPIGSFIVSNGLHTTTNFLFKSQVTLRLLFLPVLSPAAKRKRTEGSDLP